MKRIALLVLCMLSLCWSAFAQVEVEFNQKVKWDNESRYVDFKLMRDGVKTPYYGLTKEDCRCYELDGTDTIMMRIDSLVDISKKKMLSDNLTVVILADQGSQLNDEEYNKVLEALVSFVEALPDYVKVYISMMGNSETGITKTKRVKGSADIRSLVRSDDLAERSDETNRYIYASIISKIQEIGDVPIEDCYYSPKYDTVMEHNEELCKDTLSDKILFVLAGKVLWDEDEGDYESIFLRDKYMLHSEGYLTIPERLKAIYCIYFGDEDDRETLGELSFISKSTPEGRTYPSFSVDSVKNVLLGAIDSISMDYRMYYTVGEKMTYNGQPLELNLEINKANAHGVKKYSFGSQMDPIEVSPTEEGGIRSWWEIILFGVLWGILFIAVAYAVMQFLVPWLQYKIFKKKYVKKFKPSDVQTEGKNVVLEQCYYCKDNFQEGDTIVTKCHHTVHWECWEENHDRCPEYGLNSCKDGIYFYNKKKLTDERNSPYFTSWLLYGLAGGLISWILFRLLLPIKGLLSGLLIWLVKLLQGGNAPVEEYLVKIQPLLLCGLIIGFVTTFLFSYLIEFRKKTWKTMLMIAARSAGNAIIGCLAFLLGSIVIIAVGQPTTCWWIDWVPWLFFGCSVTWLLSYKSDIEFKEAILGGLSSVVFSFVVIYALSKAEPTLIVLAFMIYAAGLGAFIAVVHYTSENYYLHIEGPTKERDIAIYKWMNVAGGSNHVSIGRSANCVIEMNWDPSEEVRDKQVELYIDNDHPYCLALTDGTTYGNDHRALKEGDSILLSHGSTFTIGNTKFTYIEKDK